MASCSFSVSLFVRFFLTCGNDPDDDDLVAGGHRDVRVESVDAVVELARSEAQTRAHAEHGGHDGHDVHQVSHPAVDVLTCKLPLFI